MRFSEEQVALVLRQAAALSAAAESDAEHGPRGDLTLGELKEIGAEAGIDPAHVEQAARSMAAAPSGPAAGVVLRMPTTVQLERVVPVSLDARILPALLDLIRTEFARQGIVEETLGGFEWRARSAMGGRYVSIRGEAGRTRIRVLGNYRDGMLAATLGVGPIATMGTGALAVALGAASPFLFVPAALAGGVAAALVPWKHAFGKERRALHRVLDALAAKVEAQRRSRPR